MFNNRVKISLILVCFYGLQYVIFNTKMIKPNCFLIMLGGYFELFNLYLNYNFNSKQKVLLILYSLIWTNVLRCTHYYSDIQLLSSIIKLMLSDTIQYITGHYIPIKRNVFKSSPNKSLGGYCGAFVYFCILSYINGEITENSKIIVLGICGDLFASIIKRHLKIKDFGNFLQSHGGILDRFDNILFIYCCL